MSRSGPRSKGSVAIAALWVTVILSLLAVALAQGVRQKMRIFQHLSLKEQSRQLGESAVKKVIAEMQSAPVTLGDTATGNEWYTKRLGENERFVIETSPADFVIEDENSKININKADIPVLENLFGLLARCSAEEARQLSEAMQDFRDTDDFVTGETNGGSERGAWRQAGLAWGPKNGDFELTQELLLVKGVTKEIYSLLENYITIYGDGRVNVNTCRKEVLAALGLPASLAEKILDARKTFVFKRSSAIAQDLSRLTPLTGEEKGVLMHSIAHNEFCVTSDHFRIHGTARIFDPPFSSRFACVYGVKDGIRYWAEA